MPISFLADLFPYFRFVLPVMGMLLAVCFAVLSRWKNPFVSGVLLAVLLASVYLGFWNYTAPHWRNRGYFNAYEFYHYYMGSKYAKEIGYTNLYNATLVADQGTEARFQPSTVRNLDTHGLSAAHTVWQKEGKYRALFDGERWKEFVRDIRFFRTRVSTRLWKKMLNDKGYNGTPVWNMVSGTIANRTPTSGRGVLFLPWLDVMLVCCALGCVWWAFGHRVMLLLLLMLLTHYVTSHFTLKAAFLRLDWVMTLVMAVCMLKKERYKTAGALTAYAAAARVFPAIFVFGIGAKFLIEIVTARTVNRRYVSYLASFGITLSILVLASILYAGSLDSWKEFLHKMAVHNSDISGWRVGFKYVFLHAYDSSRGLGLKQLFEDRYVTWWGIQFAVLLLSLFLVRRLEDHEAMAYGYVPTFFLVAPTYYYHVMLAVPFLFFAGKMERPTRLLGLFMIYASAVAGHVLFARWGRASTLFHTMSCILFAMVLYMMALSLIELLKRKVPEFEPPPTEGDSEQTGDLLTS